MNDFAQHLREVFAGFGEIRLRRMFGGYGVYRDGLMFGIVFDSVLYLKADELTAPLFRDRGLGRFEYLKQGKPIQLSYYMAPEEIYEDDEEAALWASRAWEAALRKRK